jgi:hypothetical protein
MSNKKRKTPNWQRQIWLAEYQSCQQDVHAQASRYWTIVSIFIPVSTALLGWIVQSILGKNLQELTENNSVSLLLVSLFCIAMIMMLWFLLQWLYRVNSLIRVNYMRMSVIESELNMCRHNYIYWLDEGEKGKEPKMLNDGGSNKRLDFIKATHNHSKETNWFRGIIFTLIAMWGILALYIFVFLKFFQLINLFRPTPFL